MSIETILGTSSKMQPPVGRGFCRAVPSPLSPRYPEARQEPRPTPRGVLKSALSLVTTTCLALSLEPLSAAAPLPRADWSEQNRAMLFLIMDLSSINAINGINLTRDQAGKLRELARQLEAACPPRPDLKTAYRPDLGTVRDTYMELREVLLAGKDVSAALEKKVMTARGTEAAVVRLSLAKGRPAAKDCTRCHGEPAGTDVRGTEAVKTLLTQRSSSHYSPIETFMAHASGLAGWGGLLKLALFESKVDAILTPEQKEVFGSFACCLVPPKSLKDPVRAGQAAGGEQEISLLRYVRSVSAGSWPAVKTLALEMGKGLLVTRSPEITEAQKEQAARNAAQVFEKARAASDTDFELSKDQLAAELRQITGPVKSGNEKQRRFSAAMFLIGPGTVEAYDHLLQRLEAPKSAKP
jgi:hypothetical protein